MYCDSYFKVSVKSVGEICDVQQDNLKIHWIKETLVQKQRTVYFETKKIKQKLNNGLNLIRVRPLLDFSKSIRLNIISEMELIEKAASHAELLNQRK